MSTESIEVRIETAVQAALAARITAASAEGGPFETTAPSARYFWLPDTAETEESPEYPALVWVTYPNIPHGHGSSVRSCEWEVFGLTRSGPEDDPKAQLCGAIYTELRAFIDQQTLTFPAEDGLRFISWTITDADIAIGEDDDQLNMIMLSGTCDVQVTT